MYLEHSLENGVWALIVLSGFTGDTPTITLLTVTGFHSL
jgi:hypothetical protein